MSGTDLTRRASHLPSVADEGFLEEVRTQLAPKATDSELRHFAQVVAKTQLDPWSRQIYLIGRYDGRLKREVHRPQTSIDGLRLIAERTGKYEGQTPVEWCGDDGQWKDVWLSKDKPRAARVGVYKTGRTVPTYSVALWDEYVVTSRDGKLIGLWPTKPALMIAKCCEALALRKVFPQETSGLYIAEEMGQADAESTAVELPLEVLAPAAGDVAPPVAPYKPSTDAIEALLGMAQAKGLRTAQKDGGDPEQLFRLHLSLVQVANEGDITECIAAIRSRETFELLWESIETCDPVEP